MRLTPKQMKMVAVALMILWLIGLVSAILARRSRQKMSKTPNADYPLVVYLVLTGSILLVFGVVYYKMHKKAPASDAAFPPLPGTDEMPSDESPPSDV